MSTPTSDKFLDAVKAIKKREVGKWLGKKPSHEEQMVMYQLAIEPKFTTKEEAVNITDELLSRGFDPEKQMGPVRKGAQGILAESSRESREERQYAAAAIMIIFHDMP